MERKPLIGVSICAVVLLVLGSLSNVVGYQTVQTSQQNLIKERINQRELAFQTIYDIANNKEIQQIILKEQMSRGIFPTSEIPIVTKQQLRQMYFIGLILSKIINKSKILSLMKQYQIIPSSVLQMQISAIIEKNTKLSGEISQLSNLNCQCESQNTNNFPTFDIICSIFFILLIVPCLFLAVTLGLTVVLLKIRDYSINAGMTILASITKNLCSFCAFKLLFWLGVFWLIGGVLVGLECVPPTFP